MWDVWRVLPFSAGLSASGSLPSSSGCVPFQHLRQYPAFATMFCRRVQHLDMLHAWRVPLLLISSPAACRFVPLSMLCWQCLVLTTVAHVKLTNSHDSSNTAKQETTNQGACCCISAGTTHSCNCTQHPKPQQVTCWDTPRLLYTVVAAPSNTGTAPFSPHNINFVDTVWKICDT